MKKIRRFVPVVGLLLIAAVVFGSGIYTRAEEEPRIAQGVYIGKVDVGGMTSDEAETAVETYVQSVKDASITLVAGEKSITVSAAEFGIAFSGEDVIQSALDVCRSGNIIKRYKDTKDLENGNKVIEMSFTLDDAAVAALLDEKADELNQDAVEFGMVREGNGFTITDGAQGIAVNVEDSIKAVKDFLNGNWDGGDAVVELAADIVDPKGTREELEKVQDVLGAYHTNFGSSRDGRYENIRIATEKINGTVLYPGEEFSVHDAIFPLDETNGYQLAGAYENGVTVQAYGGGVCQVSTTLYNAVLLSELEVTQRSNHSMIVSYVSPSMDAAIAGDYKDLKFVNNTDTPIYLEGYLSGNDLYFTIYGEETRPSNRVISYESEILSEEDPGTRFVATADPVGTLVRTQSKHMGYVARLWKIVTVDGVEQSREIWNNSTYQSSAQIVNVGTASEDANVTAAINAAIATGDEGTVYTAVAPYNGAVGTILNPPAAAETTGQQAETTQQESAQEQPAETPQETPQEETAETVQEPAETVQEETTDGAQ